MRSLTSIVIDLSCLSLLGSAACGVDARDVARGPEESVPVTGGAAATGAAGAGAGSALTESTPASANAGAGQLDLLFVIDNSISMADKQALLGQVGNVLERFVRPRCVDAAGNQFSAAPRGMDCPAGLRRQFEPATDVHLGVITTSLGDAGANVACPAQGFPRYVPDRVDNARLLGTSLRGKVAGVNDAGFISWRAGEDELATATTFAALVTAAGEDGCGWEMPLEAWYRFLVDPHPYAELERVDCPDGSRPATECVQAVTGADGAILADDVLLAQRAAFLRPSSRLAVVMLSDENDCSVAVGGQSWVAFDIEDARKFYRASSACEQNPNDPCCYSCPRGAPSGCAEDPACDVADPAAALMANRLAPEADGQNLRCFHQKQRFGVDFLYPVARYVNALTQPTLCPGAVDLAVGGCAAPEPNPLFAGGRAPSDVFLAGIVGVPFQLLEAQVDTPGLPPVAAGFRYKIAGELSAADWDAMVGDSSASPPVAPTTPFMVESAVARAGVAVGNPINGREYSTADTVNGGSPIPDDLELACILPLPAPRDCALADPAVDACDCYPDRNDSPLCEQQPGQSMAGTLQYWGKARPGTRQLEVLRQLGQQAVVGSICARNANDRAAADFSYRPSLAALADSMAPRLQAP